MSLGSLMLVARNRLRTDLSFEDASIMVMPGPEPAPYAGQKFISIYGTQWSPGELDLNEGLDEQYAFSCTLSVRSSVSPFDRYGNDQYVQDTIGMEDVLRSIIISLHQSCSLIGAWDTLMAGQGTEFPRWTRCDPVPQIVDGSWWKSEPDFRSSPEGAAGLVMSVDFGNARRMQSLVGDDSIQ